MHLAPLVVALVVSVESGAEKVEMSSLDLEALLSLETDVASSAELTLRESPAIITVISRDEITRVGARDLMDVLMLVPGVGFGVDVQGVAGIGFRGLWGNEGKVLLLIDGQPMNELLYGTLQFGNHVPVELIERVEVIRGPGSVVYGGFAELAVISVITRSAAALDGGAAAVTYGRMRDTTGRWQASVGFGQRIGELEVVGQAAYGQGIRSDRIFVDANGDRFDMQDASDTNPGFVNVGVRYKKLEARFIYDDYRMSEQSELGTVASAPVEMAFRTARGDIRYDLDLTSTLTVTPRVSLTWQKPWNTEDQSTATFYNKTTRRVTAGATALWSAHETLSVAIGGDVWLDHANINADEADIGFNGSFDGATSVDYQNYIGFIDALWRTSLVNVEAGARIEHHSQFGGSFVPRLALTRVFGDFHVKGLASRAFRAPVIENIAANPDITPERTTAFELEGGYRIGPRLFLSANLFDLTVTDPIVYGVDPSSGEELYVNAGNIGSRGVESVLRYSYEGSYATLGYSFYTTAGKDTTPTYEVPGRENVALAWPTHKLTLATSFALTPWLSLGGTAVGMSRRYAIAGVDAAGDTVTSSFKPVVFLSATLFVHDVGVKGLEGSLSLHNLGDARNPLIQPYDGGHPPYIGPGREVVLRVAYAF